MPEAAVRIVDLSTHSEPFVTVDELATYYGVSDDTIRRDIHKGALAAVRVGTKGQLRIRIDEARRYGKSGPPQ